MGRSESRKARTCARARAHTHTHTRKADSNLNTQENELASIGSTPSRSDSEASSDTRR